MQNRKQLKLEIELVPSSSWQNNLRSLFTPSMWNKLRNRVYDKAKRKCTICYTPTKKLHAHEVWEYDDTKHIQKLVDIIALCYKCHSIKHIGFAGIQASQGKINYERLVKHFMGVNKCDRVTFEKHLKNAYKNFEERSKFEWQLNLERLKQFA